MRIEHTTSATINGLFPGELTPVLTAGARRYLRAANHTGRMWNSAVSQVPHTPTLAPTRTIALTLPEP